MKFRYTATDSAGQSATGTISARNTEDAADKLFARGLVPSSVEPANKNAAASSASKGSGAGASRKRESASHLCSFARQLALLTDTGTPLLQALQAYERQVQEGTPWRVAVEQVRTSVEEGRSLAEALDTCGERFPPVYRSLIAAGEAGGKLSAMMKRLAEMTQRQVRTQNMLKGAMLYPTLLIFIAIVVVCVMLTVVMPKFADMFQTLDAPMPASTAVMMDLSAFLRTQWYFVVGGIAALGTCVWAASKSAGVRIAVERTLIAAPVIGPVIRSVAAARVARVLGVLLESRVPMLEALDLTSAAAGLASYRELIGRCKDTVTLGEPMGPVLQASTLLPASVAEAVQTGERTGRLGMVLVNLADYLDEENESAVKSLTSLLEPLILLGLGLVVGGMSVSMFLPLFDLTASAAGG